MNAAIFSDAQSRRAAAWGWRCDGLTWVEIGKKLGVSTARARQIGFAGKRQIENPRPQNGLPVRVYNVLRWLLDEDDIRPEIIAEMDPHQLLDQPNFGLKSLSDLNGWLEDHGYDALMVRKFKINPVMAARKIRNIAEQYPPSPHETAEQWILRLLSGQP